MLIPMPGYALVELPKKYESGLSQDKEKYDTNTKGKLIDFTLTSTDWADLDSEGLNKIADAFKASKEKTVYFDKFQDGEVIDHEKKQYVFVPVKQIRGVEYAKA